MKRVNLSLIIIIVAGLLLCRLGYPTDSAFAQFDKIKKAVGGDKKKDKDKKEKKESASDKTTGGEKNTGGKTTGGGNELAGYNLTGPLGAAIKNNDEELFIKRMEDCWDGFWEKHEGIA